MNLFYQLCRHTLATKLGGRPPPPKPVARHRLIERLAEELDRTLILRAASAGLGTPTLLSVWVSPRHLPGPQPGCGVYTPWGSLIAWSMV
jgi:ATP/maltotriose-dependent transcriptional regulator MalT